MSAKKISISIAAILLIFFSVLLFYPRNASQQVVVPLSIEQTIAQFKQPERVQLWFKAVERKDNAAIKTEDNGRWTIHSNQHSLKIITANSFSATLELSDEKDRERLQYNVVPDSNNIYQTIVTLIYRTNLFQQLTGESSLHNLAFESLRSFGAFTNSSIRFYGYEIRHTLVTDSAYLFTSKSVANGGIQQAAVGIFDQLIAYATRNKIKFTGTKIINIFPLTGDSVRVSGGIAVTSYFVPSVADNIHYKNMPYGKKLLEAPYKGSYSGLPKVFGALQKYAHDHQLTNMAIPYGKYLSDNYNYSDNDIIDLMVYFPVD